MTEQDLIIQNLRRENEELWTAYHEIAEDLVAFGRVDYWLCDEVPQELHLKYHPQNDGNYENEPCVECVKDYYFSKNRKQKEIELAQRNEMRWISVEDRQPNNKGCYLLTVKHWFDGEPVVREAYWNGEDWLSCDDRRYKITPRVTHWMPLPTPPKED